MSALIICHPERSEGSAFRLGRDQKQIPRFARDDRTRDIPRFFLTSDLHRSRFAEHGPRATAFHA